MKLHDPILARFRRALAGIYGDRIERVVLYGSRARGDGRPDSDYDIAVFLKDIDGFAEEAERLARIETDILYDTGAVINALPFKAGAYQNRTGLMGELRRDGIDLWPEAKDYLDKAREELDEARKIAAIGLAKAAARGAYFVAFHSAEAFIIERTGKVAKTHVGVRSEFARLAKNEPRLDKSFVAFLAQAYKYKEIGDYGVGGRGPPSASKKPRKPLRRPPVSSTA